MTRLLNRKIKVFLDGRIFSSDQGLDIDVDRHEAFNKFAVTSVTLWNPNPDTIGACDSRQDPLDPELEVKPWMVVHAGYEPAPGEKRSEVLALGYVTSYKLEEHGADKALVILMEDAAKLNVTGLKREYRVPMSVVELLTRIATPYYTRISVGENKVLPRFAFTDEIQAVRSLVSASSSVLWYRGGLLTVIPNDLPLEEPTLINEDSGLLRRPEKLATGLKDERGYEFRTLYIPGVSLGRTMGVIYGNGKKRIDGRIFETQTVFSTYASNYQIHKMKAAA